MQSPELPSYDDPFVAEASREWDRLLREDPPTIEDVVAWQAQHHLVGEQPLCKTLRPNFVSTQQLAADRQSTEAVFSALLRAGDRIVADPALRQRYLGNYWDTYAEFFELDCGHPQRCMSARMDAYPTPTGLKFFELNTSAGGRDHVDSLTRMFTQLALFQRFAQSFRLEPLLTSSPKGAAILATYREWGGRNEPPNIAALLGGGPQRTPLQSLDLTMARSIIRSDKIKVAYVDPRELTYEGGRLYHHGKSIDIVNCGVLTELVKFGRPAMETLLSAVRSRAVCLVTAFNIYGHKALFGAITDPEVDLGLTTAERLAVRAHVPWARTVGDVRTSDPSGEPIELLRWATDHQEHLVLKPTTEYGSKGVVLGWEVAAAAWQQALAEAQVGPATHILQDRVYSPKTKWPLLAPGIPDVDWSVDRSPFLDRGQLTGYCTRMSTSSVTNVGAGGSVAPTLVLRSRA